MFVLLVLLAPKSVSSVRSWSYECYRTQQRTWPTTAQLTRLDVALVCFPFEAGCFSFGRTTHLCCFFFIIIIIFVLHS